MSEAEAKQPESDIVTVKITWNSKTGELQVEGPGNNEMLFDFLLKKAGEAAAGLRANIAKQQQQQGIVLANGNMRIPNLRQGGA